jgi:hypothetical protein
MGQRMDTPDDDLSEPSSGKPFHNPLILSPTCQDCISCYRSCVYEASQRMCYDIVFQPLAYYVNIVNRVLNGADHNIQCTIGFGIYGIYPAYNN